MVELTIIENEVANYILDGLSNKEISDKQFVTEQTIKFHITNIYKKTQVESRAQFIARFHQDRAFIGGNMNIHLPAKNNPEPVVKSSSAINDELNRDKINFIDDKFKVGKSIDQLHNMMMEVTSKEMTAANVNAACNCVSRINETINTAISAARFLSGR